MAGTDRCRENRVFVYGTLRREAAPRGPVRLRRGWRFEGYGTVSGELYDVGPYPGAVPSSDPAARVRGEVHRLLQAEQTLGELDRYEGCGPHDSRPHEFERELVEVELEAGGTVSAWIYWYRLPPRGRRVHSGDYVERAGSE